MRTIIVILALLPVSYAQKINFSPLPESAVVERREPVPALANRQARLEELFRQAGCRDVDRTGEAAGAVDDQVDLGLAPLHDVHVIRIELEREVGVGRADGEPVNELAAAASSVLKVAQSHPIGAVGGCPPLPGGTGRTALGLGPATRSR